MLLQELFSVTDINALRTSLFFLALNIVVVSGILLWSRGIFITLWLCGRAVVGLIGFLRKIRNAISTLAVISFKLLKGALSRRKSDWSEINELFEGLRRPPPRTANTQTTEYKIEPRDDGLPSSDVMGWEFDYIRNTASEAMRDRHTMVNFYLLIAAVIVTGVVAVVNPQQGAAESLPLQAGTVLLWSLSGIGWFYLLKIIRLREAWHDSARAMNQIKNFYILHSKEFPDGKLLEAFRWSMETMPKPDQEWNVFFYSAALIGLLNSLAFALGGVLLSGATTTNTTRIQSMSSFLESNLLIMIGLALVYFAFHILMYFAFLKPRPR